MRTHRISEGPANRVIVLLTMLCFILFNVSCASGRKRIVPVSSLKANKIQKMRFYGLLTYANKWIQFDIGNLGKLAVDRVKGLALVKGELEWVSVPWSNVRMVEIQKSSTAGGIGNFFLGLSAVTFVVIMVIYYSAGGFF